MKYSGFCPDMKRHVLMFSTSGQRQVTTCCTCAVTSQKKCHVSGCRHQAGNICCLGCLIKLWCEHGLTFSRKKSKLNLREEGYTSISKALTTASIMYLERKGDRRTMKQTTIRATGNAKEPDLQEPN